MNNSYVRATWSVVRFAKYVRGTVEPVIPWRPAMRALRKDVLLKMIVQ